jgi:hypothetical protein
MRRRRSATPVARDEVWRCRRLAERAAGCREACLEFTVPPVLRNEFDSSGAHSGANHIWGRSRASAWLKPKLR